MIFEPSQDYMRSKWLPNLVAEYLNPGGDTTYDASVGWANARGAVIFSTARRQIQRGARRRCHRGDFLFPRSALSPERRHGRRGDEAPARWMIAVRHRAGSLDAAVSSARTRNLATSLVLIGLLGGAAWALVRFTARSRRLSEMQFRFAAGVSHDLAHAAHGHPGAAFNLVEGVVKEPAATARYARLILRNAEELTSMIENVLAFSSSLARTRKNGARRSPWGIFCNTPPE